MSFWSISCDDSQIPWLCKQHACGSRPPTPTSVKFHKHLIHVSNELGWLINSPKVLTTVASVICKTSDPIITYKRSFLFLMPRGQELSFSIGESNSGCYDFPCSHFTFESQTSTFEWRMSALSPDGEFEPLLSGLGHSDRWLSGTQHIPGDAVG